MSQNKKAYFQGGGGPNEPTPKKKKYRSEKAIVVQPRFEEPFYRNYDLYDVEGEHGPGTGAYRMDKHKSIKEFLTNKREKLKNKYKAKDSWIEDTKSNKEERVQKMKTRAHLLSQLTKVAIDFPIDDQIDSGYIGEHSGSYEDSVDLDGRLDKYLPFPDFEGKTVDKLNFGRDYEGTESDKKIIKLLYKFLNKYFNPKETELLGMSNGFEPEEDLDSDKTLNDINPEYGTTDSGNTIYDKMWI